MLPKKVAVLLLVFTLISLDSTVTSGLPWRKKCTNEEKIYILYVCGPYIMASNPRGLPPKTDACCAAVVIAQNLGVRRMQCIVDRLTRAEKQQYNARTMLYLVTHCTYN